MKYKDMVGEQVGQLKVVSMSHKDHSSNYYFKCICSCGNFRICQGTQLRAGKFDACHQCSVQESREAKSKVEAAKLQDGALNEVLARLEDLLLSVEENGRELEDIIAYARQVKAKPTK
jgi:hypothetical protein